MVHYKTISEWFQAWQQPKPEHPLISLRKVDISTMMRGGQSWASCCDFYYIALKRVTGAEKLKLKYGQHPYDFNEGIMSFVSPGQVTSLVVESDVQVNQTGWYVIIHPDFLWNTALASRIKKYDFWDYAVNESLFLSEKEEEIIVNLIENIHRETHSNLDKFSKQIIISQLESLLNYAERFYNRQFLTREKANHSVIERLEKALSDYFNSGRSASQGLPTVNEVAGLLNISPKYLSSLLRMHTGQNAQHFIHS